VTYPGITTNLFWDLPLSFFPLLLHTTKQLSTCIHLRAMGYGSAAKSHTKIQCIHGKCEGRTARRISTPLLLFLLLFACLHGGTHDSNEDDGMWRNFELLFSSLLCLPFSRLSGRSRWTDPFLLLHLSFPIQFFPVILQSHGTRRLLREPKNATEEKSNGLDGFLFAGCHGRWGKRRR